jgi:hypothetical protein
MRLRYKEDPREWRKSALLTVGGVAVISSLLCWRHIFSQKTWLVICVTLAILALLIVGRPRWFRAYYRGSLWLGFQISKFFGELVLFVFFILVISPLGIFMRMLGKDPLQISRPKAVLTYWQKSKDSTPLDSQF